MEIKVQRLSLWIIKTTGVPYARFNT
ncbi:protein YmgL [Escherichia coli]